ncbi:MAG TPA: Wzz/FepE/Etk N-terminal domain-containing protein [Fimbriimonadaceae bacterium]|nr:Wzz/FepE/Etk N-terminal domain-containing protein [Fimbriimonadaceae bacterium]HRE92874.1 Wzz/FepE/Etk N-terminal domain-containing protein [Fimbriimonadaceae bacterium]HRI74459.1 Wzz/FepE/Etk N-terminal domain-containing protein [Fimbriimonadaceae bacterium]
MPDSQKLQTADDIDLKQLSRSLRSRWYLPVGFAFLLGVLAGVYTFTQRPVFQANAVLFIPPTGNRATTNGIPGFGSLDMTAMLDGIMKSERIRKPVRESMQLSREEFNEAFQVVPNVIENRVEVKIKDTDKNRALEGMKRVLIELREVDNETGMNVTRSKLSETKSALDSARKELVQAEEDLLKFQNELTTVPDSDKSYMATGSLKLVQEIESELRAVNDEYAKRKAQMQNNVSAGDDIPRGVPSIDALRADLRQKEVARSTALSLYQPDTPQVKQANEAVEAVRKALAVEVQRYRAAEKLDIDPRMIELITRREVLSNQLDRERKRAQVAPEQATGLQRKLRAVQQADRKVTTILDAVNNLEQQSQVSGVQWTVLDAPYVLDEPINKSYGRNIIVFGFIGGLIGLAAASRSRSKSG